VSYSSGEEVALVAAPLVFKTQREPVAKCTTEVGGIGVAESIADLRDREAPVREKMLRSAAPMAAGQCTKGGSAVGRSSIRRG